MKSFIENPTNSSAKDSKINHDTNGYSPIAVIDCENAGWVICSTEYNSFYNVEFATYLSIADDFVPTGTGHEMFFESQFAAIRYALDKKMRNVTFAFKIS